VLDDKADFQLIDVREPHEVLVASIGGELIPQGQVQDNIGKVSRDKKVVIYCRTGNRSGRIVDMLDKQGYTNCYNLVGGINRYSDDVDNSLTKY